MAIDVSIQLWMTCVMIIMLGLIVAGYVGYSRRKKENQDKE